MTSKNTTTDIRPGKLENEAPSTDIVVADTTSTELATRSVNIADTIQLSLSRVKIAYAVSQNLPEDATEGSLVISNSDGGWSKLLPANSPTPLTVLIMSARSYYKEWLTADAFNTGARPKTYATAEQAKADGQTVAWVGDSRPTVSEAFDINMLVKQPEGMTDGADAFTLILDGEAWAPCIMTIDKTGAPKVRTFLSSLLLRDASNRKVPISQGRTNGCFCTLCVKSQPSRSNPARKFRVATFAGKLGEDHRPVIPSQAFLDDLAMIASCLSNPENNANAADSEDIPF